MTDPEPTSASADSTEILRGRPRVGARRGESPTVKGRVTHEELAELQEVMTAMDWTQSELVRRGAQLVIREYRTVTELATASDASTMRPTQDDSGRLV